MKENTNKHLHIQTLLVNRLLEIAYQYIRMLEVGLASIKDYHGYPSDVNKVNMINIHAETQN